MARKIYDKETKTGWKRIEGQWQYFDNGLVKLPGTDQIKFLKAATGAVYQAGVNTRSTVHNFVEQDKKLRAKQRQSKIQEYKDLGTAVSNFDLKKEVKEEGGRVVKNLGNALSDFTKIGQGSGEFNDKGRELSVFELRRQNEKYRNQLETESLEEIELPEGGDFYCLALMDNYTGELGSDYNKTWEGVDTSNFDAYQNINFKNAMSETYWLTEAVNGPTYSLQTKENSYTNLAKSNDLTQMGGTPANATATIEAAAGVETNDTPSYTPPVVSKSSTTVDSATANLPAQAQTRAAEVAKEEPKVTQWYDLEGEDGGAAAKALWKQNNQPEQVKIDPIEFKDPVQSSLLFRDLQPETAINPLRNA
jgi:hypothetical protein